MNKMWSFPLELTSLSITCLCIIDLVMFSKYKSASFTCFYFVLMELFHLVGLYDASYSCSSFLHC